MGCHYLCLFNNLIIKYPCIGIQPAIGRSYTLHKLRRTRLLRAVDKILLQHYLCGIIPDLNFNGNRTTQTGKIKMLA